MSMKLFLKNFNQKCIFYQNCPNSISIYLIFDQVILIFILIFNLIYVKIIMFINISDNYFWQIFIKNAFSVKIVQIRGVLYFIFY
jgi:hypothetical protein